MLLFYRRNVISQPRTNQSDKRQSPVYGGPRFHQVQLHFVIH